jgi:hypothetical protein
VLKESSTHITKKFSFDNSNETSFTRFNLCENLSITILVNNLFIKQKDGRQNKTSYLFRYQIENKKKEIMAE